MSKSKNTNNVTAKMYDTLVRPVITEKSMLSSENGKVTFIVPLCASKDEVKAAVEHNTANNAGKTAFFAVLFFQRFSLLAFLLFY